MVLPGVLEKHKLGYVRGGEITPSGRVCLQSHSGWGTCALAAEHRGREGTHTEGAPKQRGLKAPQKQEGKTGRTLLLQVLSSSKSSNTPHFFFQVAEEEVSRTPYLPKKENRDLLGCSAAAPQPQAPAAQGRAVS